MLGWARKSRHALAISALVGISTVARTGDTEPGPAASAATAASAPAIPISPPIDAGPINAAIQRLAADVKRWGGTVGVSVIDVSTGQTIAALSEHAPKNPASNAKLATA